MAPMDGLSERAVAPDPVAQFRVWYDDARAAMGDDADAVVVATADVGGAPSGWKGTPTTRASGCHSRTRCSAASSRARPSARIVGCGVAVRSSRLPTATPVRRAP